MQTYHRCQVLASAFVIGCGKQSNLDSWRGRRPRPCFSFDASLTSNSTLSCKFWTDFTPSMHSFECWTGNFFFFFFKMKGIANGILVTYDATMAGCSCPAFSGTQNVSSLQKEEAWRVNVRIQGCDLEHGYLCGTMEALNVPMADTPVVTFWEGEIVDTKNYTFFTDKWEATYVPFFLSFI
ncbi:hypothetical protein EZV62_016478 [Acer yangbiense]|uniref:Uncharacterized protein n=1 Tax=Acer yangbiense TaxID=1000413 RepID=A0A5C7HP92_9ROSI|nr:hypothetical protein EZV62_016478 [Acer yangbiense]